MLVRVELEVDVVEQAHGGPLVRLVAVVQVLGIPAHYTFHGKPVLDVEGILVVAAEQLQRLVVVVQLAHSVPFPYPMAIAAHCRVYQGGVPCDRFVQV